jgi:hypothetical protein
MTELLHHNNMKMEYDGYDDENAKPDMVTKVMLINQVIAID